MPSENSDFIDNNTKQLHQDFSKNEETSDNSSKVDEESVINVVDEECSSEVLLNKQTPSFRCLGQLLLSESSLFRHPLYLFPPLEDPGIDDAFKFNKPEPIQDNIGVEKYKDMCKKLEIVPLTRIIKSLQTNVLDLKFYGLTDKQMKALTEAMKTNIYIKELNLQENVLSVESVKLLSEIIEENITLEILNLQQCCIGQAGPEILNASIADCLLLRDLDLSFNYLCDKGLLLLKSGLCENQTIKKLNLSHNNLTEESAETIQDILIANKSIEHLNLAWNNFCTGPGNKKLSKGLTLNGQIKSLNLSWNGIGTGPSMRPIRRFIIKSKVLKYLDLSNNCLTGQSLRMARVALFKNTSLIEVKIGNNIYNADEALYLATVLSEKKREDPLKFLDMENMFVKKEFMSLLGTIKKLDRRIKIGGVLSNYEIVGPNDLKLLFDRCQYLLMKPKKKKKQKNFGHFILSMPEGKVTADEFKILLKKKKIRKLDKDLCKELTSRFETKRKKIDCVSMRTAYMELYPETALPPPKPKKLKKGKGKHKKQGKKADNQEKEHKGDAAENGVGENQPKSIGETEGKLIEEKHLMKKIKSLKEVHVSKKRKFSGYSETTI